MLKINDVCKTFGNQMVLNHITLSLKTSGIIGLAGPSGSGKSTLLRCIQKLETLDTGNIKCDVKTGFMFQDFQLFPHMTVLENLLYAPKMRNRTENHTVCAKKLLHELGILSKANSYPHQLSGGQKQRVALARSLMMHPDLLLCDEPTSGLDVATTLSVLDLLKSVRDMGVAMIIASHDLDFLTKIADRIVMLKEGSIIVDISPDSTVDPIAYLKTYY